MAGCAETDENVVHCTVTEIVEPKTAVGVKSWLPKFVPWSETGEAAVSAMFCASDCVTIGASYVINPTIEPG
jgi:hypothetical protein